MKKNLLFVTISLGLLAATLMILQFTAAHNQGDSLQHRHTGLTLEMIQPLSTLVTTRVTVADVLESRIAGYTGAVKAALIVKGDYLLGVDLSQAHFQQIDEEKQTAVLVLPPPAVTSPRVDHQRTRLFAVSESGLWQIVPGNGAEVAVVNAAYKEAQEAIAQAANQPAALDSARRQAEQVLQTFFGAIGWTLRVQWSDQSPTTQPSAAEQERYHEGEPCMSRLRYPPRPNAAPTQMTAT